MVNLDEEMQRAQDAKHDIVNAATDREALIHAFDGIGTLLLTVVNEVRELRERLNA